MLSSFFKERCEPKSSQGASCSQQGGNTWIRSAMCLPSDMKELQNEGAGESLLATGHNFVELRGGRFWEV